MKTHPHRSLNQQCRLVHKSLCNARQTQRTLLPVNTQMPFMQMRISKFHLLKNSGKTSSLSRGSPACHYTWGALLVSKPYEHWSNLLYRILNWSTHEFNLTYSFPLSGKVMGPTFGPTLESGWIKNGKRCQRYNGSSKHWVFEFDLISSALTSLLTYNELASY